MIEGPIHPDDYITILLDRNSSIVLSDLIFRPITYLKFYITTLKIVITRTVQEQKIQKELDDCVKTDQVQFNFPLTVKNY